MTEKEFEVQKALGLADEYILSITTTFQVTIQQVKDAVEKHSFVSKCIEETRDYYEEAPTFANAKLKFEVKCVTKITQLIMAELHPHPIEIWMTFKSVSKIIKDGYGYYGRIIV